MQQQQQCDCRKDQPKIDQTHERERMIIMMMLQQASHAVVAAASLAVANK
jgi:hypothetical protein